jgi:hypothetical protein
MTGHHQRSGISKEIDPNRVVGQCNHSGILWAIYLRSIRVKPTSPSVINATDKQPVLKVDALIP